MPEHHYELKISLKVDDDTYFPEWVENFILDKLDQPNDWDDIGSQVTAMFMGAIDAVHGMTHEETSVRYLHTSETDPYPITSINGNVIDVKFGGKKSKLPSYQDTAISEIKKNMVQQELFDSDLQ